MGERRRTQSRRLDELARSVSLSDSGIFKLSEKSPPNQLLKYSNAEENMMQEITCLKSKNSSLETKLNQYMEENASLMRYKEDCEKDRVEVMKYKEDNDALHAEMLKCKEDFKRQADELNRCMREKTSLMRYKEDSERERVELIKYREDYNTLQSEVLKCEEDCKRLVEEITKYKEEVEKLQKELLGSNALKNEKICALELEIEQYKMRLIHQEAVNKSVISLREMNKCMIGDLERKKRRIEDLGRLSYKATSTNSSVCCLPYLEENVWTRLSFRKRIEVLEKEVKRLSGLIEQQNQMLISAKYAFIKRGEYVKYLERRLLEFLGNKAAQNFFSEYNVIMNQRSERYSQQISGNLDAVPPQHAVRQCESEKQPGGGCEQNSPSESSSNNVLMSQVKREAKELHKLDSLSLSPISGKLDANVASSSSGRNIVTTTSTVYKHIKRRRRIISNAEACRSEANSCFASNSTQGRGMMPTTSIDRRCSEQQNSNAVVCGPLHTGDEQVNGDLRHCSDSSSHCRGLFVNEFKKNTCSQVAANIDSFTDFVSRQVDCSHSSSHLVDGNMTLSSNVACKSSNEVDNCRQQPMITSTRSNSCSESLRTLRYRKRCSQSEVSCFPRPPINSMGNSSSITGKLSPGVTKLDFGKDVRRRCTRNHPSESTTIKPCISPIQSQPGNELPNINVVSSCQQDCVTSSQVDSLPWKEVDSPSCSAGSLSDVSSRKRHRSSSFDKPDSTSCSCKSPCISAVKKRKRNQLVPSIETAVDASSKHLSSNSFALEQSSGAELNEISNHLNMSPSDGKLPEVQGETEKVMELNSDNGSAQQLISESCSTDGIMANDHNDIIQTNVEKGDSFKETTMPHESTAYCGTGAENNESPIQSNLKCVSELDLGSPDVSDQEISSENEVLVIENSCVNKNEVQEDSSSNASLQTAVQTSSISKSSDACLSVPNVNNSRNPSLQNEIAMIGKSENQSSLDRSGLDADQHEILNSDQNQAQDGTYSGPAVTQEKFCHKANEKNSVMRNFPQSDNLSTKQGIKMIAMETEKSSCDVVPHNTQRKGSSRAGKKSKKWQPPEPAMQEKLFSTLSSLEGLRYNQARFKLSRHTVEGVICTPSYVQSVDFAVKTITAYLCTSKRNPLLSYTDSRNPNVLKPLVEKCIAEALISVEKKKKGYLNGLVESLMLNLRAKVLQDSELSIYAASALCRVYVMLCELKEKYEDARSLVFELLESTRSDFHHVVASAAGVWPAILKSPELEFMNQILGFVLFKKPDSLPDALWRECSILLNYCCVPNPSASDIVQHIREFLHYLIVQRKDIDEKVPPPGEYQDIIILLIREFEWNWIAKIFETTLWDIFRAERLRTRVKFPQTFTRAVDLIDFIEHCSPPDAERFTSRFDLKKSK